MWLIDECIDVKQNALQRQTVWSSIALRCIEVLGWCILVIERAFSFCTTDCCISSYHVSCLSGLRSASHLLSTMISNAAATPQQPHQEKDPAQILAKQFNMTDAEAEMILCIVRKNDPNLELLKLPKVQEIITHRKGRWIQVSSLWSRWRLASLIDVAWYYDHRCWYNPRIFFVLTKINRRKKKTFPSFYVKNLV